MFLLEKEKMLSKCNFSKAGKRNTKTLRIVRKSTVLNFSSSKTILM
jgi:hypothetical protein